MAVVDNGVCGGSAPGASNYIDEIHERVNARSLCKTLNYKYSYLPDIFTAEILKKYADKIVTNDNHSRLYPMKKQLLNQEFIIKDENSK